MLLALVAMVALAFGSVHGSSSTAGARESQLDSIIKCPACQDLSIAQSDAPSSVALRRRVAQFVNAGWPNARIESWVTSRYGSNALLVPQGGGVADTLYLVPVAAIGVAVAGLGWYLWRRRSPRRGEPLPSTLPAGPDSDSTAASAAVADPPHEHPLEAYLHHHGSASTGDHPRVG